ncbi:RNA polymerase sigma factor [Streptomyces sp. NPDC002755]|uniref:RNA polymerase sigma factor n=1 Tax=Streptomyces sp. NPDC002884 TaxID=3154544 RepID=UPI003321DBA9
MRARVRSGERAAFAELYELYATAVYNHALRLSGDWSVAEEVMSETFLAAWRGRGAVEVEGGSLRPWLFGIATNKARNADRSLRRRLAFLARRAEAGAGTGGSGSGGSGTGGGEAVGDFAEELVGRIDDARRLAEVRRVLGRLRRHEREVIALCVWGGLDYAQAAEALGVPVGTVRSRLSRARTRLREIVEREARRAGPRAETRGEPRFRRGEVESETAFAVLPIQEEAR